MEVNIVNQTEQNEWMKYEPDFKAIQEKIVKVLHCNENAECSLIFVGPEAIQEINRDYRKIDRPTDVISFALQDSEDEMALDEITDELGDIFINVEAVVAQAKEYGHSEKREVMFLFTHGMLHLLGYDHMNEEDEKIMFALQDVILDGFTFKKFINAFNGLIIGLKDKSVLLQVVIAIGVVAFGLIYGFNAVEWTLVTACILLVIAAEIFNTALEILCNKVEPKQDELIRKVKDLGAAGVLTVSMIAVVIGLAVLKGIFQ